MVDVGLLFILEFLMDFMLIHDLSDGILQFQVPIQPPVLREPLSTALGGLGEVRGHQPADSHHHPGPFGMHIDHLRLCKMPKQRRNGLKMSVKARVFSRKHTLKP